MYLFRLIYYSKMAAVNPDDPNLRGDLKGILAAAKRNNLANGVTGSLLFNQNYFAQVLEGDRKAVTDTFCRISQDPRHTDIVILEGKAITERRFADWSMCFVGQPIDEEVYRRFCITGEFLPMKMTADSMLGFMEALIDSAPNAVRTNQPEAANAPGSNAASKKVFGERVLNREKFRNKKPEPAAQPA